MNANEARLLTEDALSSKRVLERVHRRISDVAYGGNSKCIISQEEHNIAYKSLISEGFFISRNMMGDYTVSWYPEEKE